MLPRVETSAFHQQVGSDELSKNILHYPTVRWREMITFTRTITKMLLVMLNIKNKTKNCGQNFGMVCDFWSWLYLTTLHWRCSGEGFNAERYIKKCLSKLPQLVNTQHTNNKIGFFLPDFATCHYSRITRNWYESNNINFVPKVGNASNLPQARAIEEFWSILNRKVYNNGWEAQND